MFKKFVICTLVLLCSLFLVVGCDSKENDSTDSTEDKKEEVVTYKVTFKDSDGTTLKEETVESGKSATAPTVNDKDNGQGFAGWDKDFSNITSDLVVTAKYEVKAYTVTFNISNGKVIVYSSQDYTQTGKESNVAYSLNKDDFTYDNSGAGQVNFKVVPNDGYKIGQITIEGTYNNLKDSTDTLYENVYRITQINSNLTVNIEILEEKEELTGYKVTFDESSDYEIIVYENQDYTKAGTKTNITYANDGEDTPAIKMDGNDQVNFKINVLKEGYVVDQITVEGGYNKIKYPEDTLAEDTYRITKISTDIIVTITLKEGEGEPLPTGYKVTFTGEHVTVYAYASKDYTTTPSQVTETYATNGDTGANDMTGEGQVNFYLVFDEGYELDSITATGTYKNLKNDNSNANEDVVYRITKIQSDLVVTILAKAK